MLQTFSEKVFYKDLIQNLYSMSNKNVLRGNNKPFLNKLLRNSISTRLPLHRKATKTSDPGDIGKYKKLRNLVKLLTTKTKKGYYKNLHLKDVDRTKRFWQAF